MASLGWNLRTWDRKDDSWFHSLHLLMSCFHKLINTPVTADLCCPPEEGVLLFSLGCSVYVKKCKCSSSQEVSQGKKDNGEERRSSWFFHTLFSEHTCFSFSSVSTPGLGGCQWQASRTMPQNIFTLISQLQQWHPPRQLLLGWSWPLYASAVWDQPRRTVYFCRVLQGWAERCRRFSITNTSCLRDPD